MEAQLTQKRHPGSGPIEYVNATLEPERAAEILRYEQLHPPTTAEGGDAGAQDEKFLVKTVVLTWEL